MSDQSSGVCEKFYILNGLWIGCSFCNVWIHNRCDPTVVTKEAAENINLYACPSCRKEGKEITMKEVMIEDTDEEEEDTSNVEPNVERDNEEGERKYNFPGWNFPKCTWCKKRLQKKGKANIQKINHERWCKMRPKEA